MWKYLFRRFLALLLSFWLIISVVFLLSRLLPGDFAAQQLSALQEEIHTSGNTDTETALKQLRYKTGLDLPLFYFSIHAAAEPDSLAKIKPEPTRQHLRQLMLSYGSAPAADYYQRVFKLISGKTAKKPSAPESVAWQNRFLQCRQPHELEAVLQAFAQAFPAASGQETAQVQQSFAQMVQTPPPVSSWLPGWHWHGTENQYHHWLQSLTELNLGFSLRDARPVSVIIAEALSNTLALLLLSLALTWLAALQLGLWLTETKTIRLKQMSLSFLFLLDSIPLFVLALLLLTGVSIAGFYQLLPDYGAIHSESGFLFFDSAWLLPVLCLCIGSLPYVTSQVYQNLKAVQMQDFVKTARAKGLSERRVLRKHVLRNALFPLITTFSEFLPGLITGALVLEVIFSIPGTGRLLLDATLSRDYPVLMALVALAALFRILSLLLADVFYYFTDPRLRLKQ